MLSEDIAKLMSMIPHEEVQAKTEGTDQIEGKAIYSKHHKHWPSTLALQGLPTRSASNKTLIRPSKMHI